MTGEIIHVRRILIFTFSVALCAACIDLVAGFRYPVPALAEISALVRLCAVGFVLWSLPAGLAALAASLPIAQLARRGLDREALWFALGSTLVLFAAMSTWEDLRRVPFNLHVLREAVPTLLVAAWVAVPAYFGARLAAWMKLIERPVPALTLLGALASVSLLLATWSVRGAGAAPPPVVRGETSGSTDISQVVLITVDTLRADHLSVYDSEAPETPKLDAFAKDALVFEQAVSPAPWTKPSLASLQTGLSPAEHGVKKMGDRLSDDFDTLADVFSSAGYVTGLIGFNPYLHPSGNLGQGFQHYRGYPRGRLGLSLAARAVYAYHLPVTTDAGDTPGLTREAIAFVEAHRDEPFFLWLHYYDPHQPYDPPKAYQPNYPAPDPELKRFDAFRTVRSGHRQLDAAGRQWVRDLYRGEVRQADANVGEVLDALKRLGLYDDALVVFTSDHGEEFWEHGGFEHGHALYEELLHVPLLIKLPGASMHARIKDRVPLESVFPTILEASGLAPDDGLPRPLALLSEAGRSDLDRDFVSEGIIYYGAQVAMTRNGKKYVRSLVTGEEALYDLANDPAERNSIAASSPALLAEMRDRLAAMPGVETGVSAQDAVEPEMDPSMLRNLKALGYAE
jgi:arylsulfatase A-like enzyme